MVPLLRRRERDHLPRADLVLRREARGGPAREPARGQLPAVAGGVRVQVARAHADDPLPQQVRHPRPEAAPRRPHQGQRAQLWRSEERPAYRDQVFVSFCPISFCFFPYCLRIAMSRLPAALQGHTTETLPRATHLLLPPYFSHRTYW